MYDWRLVMPDPVPRRPRTGSKKGRRPTQPAEKEETRAREQAGQSQGRLDAEKVAKDAKRPTIALKTGAVVDAREAAAIWRRLAAVLHVNPDEFRSLLALAQGRPGDANPRHFESLWSGYFLEMDQRTIRPVVGE